MKRIVGLTMAVLFTACGLPATHTSTGRAAQAARLPEAVATPDPTPTPVQRHVPARLQIPVIAVDAAVESLGIEKDGAMAIPSAATDVGWYSLGAAPGGTKGNAVFDGHLDWTTGRAVFWDLHKVKAGDEVDIVAADGPKLQYHVRKVESRPFDAPTGDLFTTEGEPLITLITCTGPWNGHRYRDRLLVTAAPS